MKRCIIFLLSGIFFPIMGVFASINDQEINLRDIPTQNTIAENNLLLRFVNGIPDLIPISYTGTQGMWVMIFRIAYEIKNIALWIAVIFLLISVLELLISEKDGVKKWKDRILYTSLGIVFLQSVFAIWSAFLMADNETIGSGFAWKLIINILFPIVGLLQMFAVFAFIAMGVYAFYNIVTSGYDDGARQKGLQIFIYALVGFLLIKIPEPLVRALYGNPNCPDTGGFFLGTIGDCTLSQARLSDTILIVGKIINFLNTFIALVCVILIIWAGWLILMSRGEGDALKKARSTIIYIILGLLLLVASHAIFRFFILRG